MICPGNRTVLCNKKKKACSCTGDSGSDTLVRKGPEGALEMLERVTFFVSGHVGVHRCKHSMSCTFKVQGLHALYYIYIAFQFKNLMWVLEWCHPQKAQPAAVSPWAGPGVGCSSFPCRPLLPLALTLSLYCRWSRVLLGKGKKPPADGLLFWAVSTSSLKYMVGQGFQ